MEFAVSTASIFACLFSLWVLYRKHKMSFFARHGIPGPPPHFIAGNLIDILKSKGFYSCAKSSWVKKYGKIFGFYHGGIPVLFVSDPELIKRIEVKDFENFIARTPLPVGGIVPHDDFFSSLPLKAGFRWRIARSVLSPSFTSKKVAWMSEDLKIHMENLKEELRGKADGNESFDIYPYFQYLAFDFSTHILLSMKSETLKKSGRNNPLFEDVLKTMSYRLKGLFLLAGCFPEFSLILVPLRNLADMILYWLNKPSSHGMFKRLEAFMKARKDSLQFFREDSVKLMMDGAKTIKDLYKYRTENNKNEIGKDLLSSTEQISNAANFLIAGFETTIIQQAFAIRFLVHHPEIQEKIYEEVQAVIKEEGSLTYKAAGKLTYTEQVFSETLRLFPVAFGFILREAVADYPYKNIVIPKGTLTFSAIEITQRSEEFWENAQKFDPDRFAPGKKIDPYIYQPFGQGPRQCVAIRVGQVIGRLILANLVNTFKFFPCDKSSPENEEAAYKLFQICPKNGVFVKVVFRDSGTSNLSTK